MSVSEQGGRMLIDAALAGAPWSVRRVVARLCRERGSGPVGDVIGGVFFAKNMGRLARERSAREGERAQALDAVTAAVGCADGLYRRGDAALRRAVEALAPLLAAARAGSRSRPAHRPRLGRGRESLLRELRSLGASRDEARAIVRAVLDSPQSRPELDVRVYGPDTPPKTPRT